MVLTAIVIWSALLASFGDKEDVVKLLHQKDKKTLHSKIVWASRERITASSKRIFHVSVSHSLHSSACLNTAPQRRNMRDERRAACDALLMW